MSFLETVNSLINDGYECALEMEKTNIFAEACFREYNINCQEAELKVVKESGTNDDLIYLQEAAKDGLIVKLKRAIQKLILSLKEYIGKVVDKIKVTYASKKAQDTIKKLEELSKTNPKIKKIKIQVHDVDKEQKVIQEAIDKISAQESKLKSSTSREKISNEVDTIKENCEKKRQNILKAATLTLTVTAAIALLTKYMVSLQNKALEDQLKNFDGEMYADDDETAQVIYKIRSSKITLLRQKIASGVGSIREIFGKLQGKVVVDNPFENMHDDDDDDDDEYESTDIEILTPDSEVYTETTSIEDDEVTTDTDTTVVTESVDINDIFASIEEQVNSVTESADDDVNAELDVIIDALESSILDNDDTKVENVESDELDDYLDILESAITNESSETDNTSELDAILDDLASI